ncbi:MAG TPA: ferritin-like domain-containing protein [Streptosporangiaceae bacterium]|nr:ferritin-like domain-containing protein [Streptosporangiaceae bacterium]
MTGASPSKSSGSEHASAASSPVIAALQSALAAEQAASYGYGVVGARLPQGSADQALATADWVSHMRARDQLSALITARGATPVPAAVAYQLPGPVNTPAAARTLAATLEDRVAGAYLGLVALPDSGLRSFGAQQVRAAALRAEAWRGSTQAFPGLPSSSLQS